MNFMGMWRSKLSASGLAGFKDEQDYKLSASGFTGF